MRFAALVDEYLAMDFSLPQAITLAAQDSVQQDLDVIEPEYDSSLM